ncbi:MFS transporter [Collinsella aerofaciens]|uniref:MFS transporter n=1 Tax=Collinsella aerofaciens TaxID=74426 RepID=UPI003D78E14F
MKSSDATFLSSVAIGQICDALLLTYLSIWALALSNDALAPSLVLSVSSIARSLLFLPAGRICDKQSPKIIFTMISLIRLLVFLGYFTVTVFISQNLISILIASAVLGGIEAHYATSSQAVVIQSSANQGIASLQRRYLTAQKAAAVGSALLLGLLSGSTAMHVMALLSALALLSNGLLLISPILKLSPETSRKEVESESKTIVETVKAVINSRTARLALLLILIAETATSSIQGPGYISLCAQNKWGDTILSNLLLAFSIGTTAGSAATRLFRKSPLTLRIPLFVLVISYCAIAFFSSWQIVLILSLLSGICCGLVSTQLITEYLRNTENLNRPGTITSVLNLAAFGAVSIGALLFGSIANTAGLEIAFGFFSATLLLVALLM